MIALTGTPGCGKSSVAEELKKRGFDVKSVVELAIENECILGKEKGELVIDVEKLSKFRYDGIVEGHLSHLLNPEKVIVLRCNPLIIKDRLLKRGWDYEKVMENVEAELIDVILVEALEACDDVYEIDVTEKSIEEVANAVEEILSGKGDKYRPRKVDWLSKLEKRLKEVTRW